MHWCNLIGVTCARVVVCGRAWCTSLATPAREPLAVRLVSCLCLGRPRGSWKVAQEHVRCRTYPTCVHLAASLILAASPSPLRSPLVFDLALKVGVSPNTDADGWHILHVYGSPNADDLSSDGTIMKAREGWELVCCLRTSSARLRVAALRSQSPN